MCLGVHEFFLLDILFDEVEENQRITVIYSLVLEGMPFNLCSKTNTHSYGTIRTIPCIYLHVYIFLALFKCSMLPYDNSLYINFNSFIMFFYIVC